MMGKTFPLIVNILAVSGIKDTQCGFKLFKREAAQRIFKKQKITDYGFDVEILYLAKKYKFKIKELPVVWIDSRDSRISPIKDAIKMFLDLFKIRINDLSGKY